MENNSQKLDKVAKKENGILIYNNIFEIEKTDKNELFISTYRDSIATNLDIRDSFNMLNSAFPNAFRNNEEKEKFYMVLSSRIISNKFTKKRLYDSINYLIDKKAGFRDIHISDIISWDKKRKLYTYKEYCKYCTSHTGFELEHIQKIKIDNILYWLID